ncbi:mucin-binding protein [Apilactobacillus apinorum]|uniref:mucin-binding protein n=1 Tax=Apilactobacillus apinorum TaxID=1218495 RepID=UPI0006B4B88A|nr:LPXTG cell wall anchor domain-containing protein [Apilactobacillus apinorum]
MYNKKNVQKNYDKKILRKAKKNWVIISVASFAFIGVATVFQFSAISASANANDNVVTKVNNNQQQETGVSTQQEYADYTRYIGYQESYSNLSTSGKTLSPQKIDSVHYIRTKVMNASNNLIGYSSNGTNDVDISLNDPQNGWRPRDGSDGLLPDVDSPSIQGYGNPSISRVNSTFTPGSGFTDTTNDQNVSITNGDTGQKNAIEYVKVFYDNPSAQYRVKTQYSNLTRQIDFVENSNQSTSGTHIFPTMYDSISWIRNIVLDKNGDIIGYSSSNNTDMDIPKDDSDQGWRLKSGSALTIPDVYSPSDNLEEKGYASPDLSVVHSTYSPENGFTNLNNSADVAIYDGKDSNGNVIQKNAYELVTVKYDNNRTSQTDYSNLTRQIDYVNRNDFIDDGTPFPAGYHIYPTRKDTVNYVRTRVYDVNGKLIGYSSTDVSSNVDISLNDPSQGWHVSSNSPQKIIPDVVSPTVDGYIDPSSSSYSSNYNPGSGFSNPSNKPNVIINGNPANTYEYVKVVYGRDINVITINSKTLTRNVRYVDEKGKEIYPRTTEKVNYKRAEIYSNDGKTLLGYASNLNGSKTPDISTNSDSQGWIVQDSNLKNHSVKDLTSLGYVNPNRNEITSNYTAAYGFYNPNNDSNINIYNDNNDEDIVVIYNHKVDTVTPDNPGLPGQPINPDNPNGPKWPNGTDKDSLSKTVNQTINYVDGNGKSVHDASHDQVRFGRTAMVDEVTGEVTYGDWDRDSGTFSTKLSPEVTGYVIRDSSQKTIPAVTVNPISSDINETVIYDKVGSLVPVDTIGNPIDNGSHDTSYPNDPNDTGKVTNPVIPSIPGKTPVDKDGNPLTPGSTYPIDGTKPTEDTKITYVNNNQKAKVSYIDSTTGKTLESVYLSGQPQSISDYRTTDTIRKYTDQGYKLLSDNYPVSGVKFNSDNKEQDFTVILEHKVDKVIPDNPGTLGQPIKPDKEGFSKTITRKINYVDQNGNKIHHSTIQTVTFSRTVTVNEVTGKVIYGNWTSKESSWKSFNTPLVSGYKLVNRKQSTIKSVNLNPDSIDENITVVYKKDKHKNSSSISSVKHKINYQNSNSFINSHNKSDRKLPQTGVSDENNIRILGLFLTISSLVLSLFGIRRKR